MRSMVVTFPVFHAPRGWLKDAQLWNILFMVTTLLVSHALMSALNSFSSPFLNFDLL